MGQGHEFDLPLGQLSLEEKLYFHPGRVPSSLLLLNDSWVTRQTDILRMEKTLQAPTIDGESIVFTLRLSPVGVGGRSGQAEGRTNHPALGAGAAGRLSGAGGEKLTSPDLASGLGFIKPMALSLVSLLGLALGCISGPRRSLHEPLWTHRELATTSLSLGCNSRLGFPTVSGSWKSKIRAQADSVPGESPLPGCPLTWWRTLWSLSLFLAGR